MTSRLKPASDQLSSNLPSNQLPRAPNITPAVSARKLHEAASAAIHTTSTLLKDTKWPVESNDAAQTLLQTISNLPDLPADNIPLKDTAEQFVQALEATLVSVKNASEKYGERKRGFRDGMKYKFSSLHPEKCTKILRTCKEDVEKISVVLRNHLDGVQVPGSTSGTPGNAGVPSGLQAQSTAPSGQVEGHLESSVSPSVVNTKTEEQLPDSGHAASHPASIPQTSSEVPADQEDRRPIRDGVIIAAKKTFQAVETISGAIPGVGDFVGVAAKVGLAFVDMIETMDQNEDVSKELASHTSNLSTYLEHFKKKSEVGKDDAFVTHIDNIHKELEFVRKKVSLWNSSGRLTKAFLASENAEKLKGYQDKIQNALEEMQLLVGLKTVDVVIELKHSGVREERRRLLNCLGDGSYGARGNSIEDVICLPGTRVGILNRINQWIKNTSSSTERVLWIRGMAGRGKSAIASTVARDWASKGSCAIYYFRRGTNALDGQFVCALARQLGKGLVPEVKNAILGSVRENEDIAKERLDQQFKTLIVGSLGTLQDHAHPIVIIVDALDECEEVKDAVQFVKLIDRHSSSIPTNVKFLLTCRPEAPLLVALEPRRWHTEDLDSIPDLSDDITRFLQHGFQQIRDDHGLPETWPLEVELKGIVDMSQGLFQWARTAIAYMDKKSPADRLRDLLQWSSTWTGLDKLYHQILSKAFKEVESDSMRREMLSWVLGTLVVAPYPVSLDIIMFLYADHKLFADRNVVQFLRRDILADLNSLLHIPTSSSEPIRLMHTSIRDLLVDHERCKDKPHFVDLAQNHRRLATRCLAIMERDLKLNICHLSDVSKSNLEVQCEIDTHVSKGLRYCCQSWSTHLTTGVTWSETAEARHSVLTKFQLISDEKLLSWLEVMSLTGAIADAFKMAKHVYRWYLGCSQQNFDDSLSTLWNDTQRFIAGFRELISFSPLLIYASALPQCPVDTVLWAKYGSQATIQILLPKQQLNWPRHIWRSSMSAAVCGVAFSPDGKFVATVLDDGTIQCLDVQTGAPLGEPLMHHRKSEGLVVFSPNSKVLAVTLHNNTVQLYDVQNRALLGQPLTGHSGGITSVIFSPDSKTLTTGSHDKTARLWDVQTGAQLGQLVTSHHLLIDSVVMSPDGKTLATGSYDNTIQFWNVQTRVPLGQALTGHGHKINCIVFSPDSKTLATGSYDKVIQLWDVQTRAPLGQPLACNRGYPNHIVFSPDSKTLAVVSVGTLDYGAIQLWDVQTREPLGQPHTSPIHLLRPIIFSMDSQTVTIGLTLEVYDVRTGAWLGNLVAGDRQGFSEFVLSPDGKTFATESSQSGHDGMRHWTHKTIQLWDAQTIEPLGQPLTSHYCNSTLIVFSPDSKTLLTGPDNETIQLWDLQTRAPLGQPLAGSQRIEHIVFSPNSKILAIGSDDKTIHLWDAQSGAPLCQSLTGHSSNIAHFVFSPNSQMLATGSDDKTIRLWNAWSGALLFEPLTGHSDSITSIIFLPDSKILTTGSSDHTVRFWDLQTGVLLGELLTNHHLPIDTLVLSPDGKTLATRSYDDNIQFWDVQTKELLGQLLSSWQGDVVFSPDSKTVVTWPYDNNIQLWDVQTREPLGQPLTGHTAHISSVVFSPDGRTLAAGSWDKTVRLWDVQTGESFGEPLTGHNEGDSKTLLTGSDNETVQLWDVQTRAPLGQPVAGDRRIEDVVFSPNSKILATRPDNKTVQLWDVHTRQPLGQPLTRHHDAITTVVFSPDSRTLATVSYEYPEAGNVVQLWEVQSGAPLGEPLTGHSDSIKHLVFSLDSKTLATGSDDKTVWLWDVQSGVLSSEPLTQNSSSISQVVVAPDGSTVIIKKEDDTAHLWNLETAAPSGQTLTGYMHYRVSNIFSPDSKTVATRPGYNTIQLWDAKSGSPFDGQPLTGHSHWIKHTVFSPDSKILATCSDWILQFWDACSGVALSEPLTHESGEITKLVFSPDGKTLATESPLQGVQLWDVQVRASLGHPLTSYNCWRESVVFSPDSKTLTTCIDDYDTIQLWDALSGAPLGQPLTARSSCIDHIVFSPNSKTLATWSHNIQLWDLNSTAALCEPLTDPSSPNNSPNSPWNSSWNAIVLFSPDSNALVSVSTGNIVQLWSAKTGARLGVPLAAGSDVLQSVGLYWALPWASKPLVFDRLSSDLIPHRIKIQSDWIMCGSKRLVWLPARYRERDLHIEVLSPGRLVIWSEERCDVLDVSRLFQF